MIYYIGSLAYIKSSELKSSGLIFFADKMRPDFPAKNGKVFADNTFEN